jgi:hypothetical protein
MTPWRRDRHRMLLLPKMRVQRALAGGRPSASCTEQEALTPA